jgi:hypothetical protein
MSEIMWYFYLTLFQIFIELGQQPLTTNKLGLGETR